MILPNKQVALVTGASRRIGASIARLLHAEGYDIAVHYYQSKDEARSLLDELNRRRPNSAYGFRADLRDAVAVAGLIPQVVAYFGVMDVLVNNASLFIKDTDVSDEGGWQRLFAVNVHAPFVLSKAFAETAESPNKVAINITDIHSSKPLKNYSIYCQTKAALSLQTLAFAKELAPKIRVNAVAPGAIMWPEDSNQLSDYQQQKIIAKTPLARHGDPIAIAKAVVALVQNNFITGHSLVVDGGRSIGY